METIIEATGLKKSYNGRRVLDVEEFEVRRGETLVVLGPSGAGKSVFLRLLNLLEPPTSGRIFFGGAEVQGLTGGTRVEVSRRMAMIFQDPLLFRGPVSDNVGYGLRVRRRSNREIAEKVAGILEVVNLAGSGEKHVTTLSGGEAQRVALARALVLRPEVLLLDEPFASVDPLNRRELQDDVKGILRERGMTAVFVTHDQEEASRMGDRILVLDGGKVVQGGTPREIFYEPATEFVARFVGVDNIYSGKVVGVSQGLSRVSVEGCVIEVLAGLRPGEPVTIGLRPEDVTLVPASEVGAPASSRNALEGEVVDVELSGPAARVTVCCPFSLIAFITRRSLEELEVEAGGRIGVRFKATALQVIEGAAGPFVESQ